MAPTVLLVEDDPDIRFVVRTGLEDDGLRFEEMATGEIALEVARRVSLDLALVDLRLPGMHGLEVVRRLRAEVSVYLALKTELIPVPRLVDAGSVAAGVLKALVLGPSAAESDAGLTSPVAATETIGSQDPQVEGDLVTVVLAEEFGDLSFERQVLGLGQTVLSLTGSGLAAVSFVDSDGKAVSIPVADGTIVDRALVRGDYAALIAGGPSGS